MNGQRDLANRARALFLTVPGAAPDAMEPSAGHNGEWEVVSELIALAERVDFDTRLERALDMVDDEANAVEIAARAVHKALPDHSTEVLLVGSKGVNLLQVAEAGPDDEGPGCPVIGPNDCPAIQRAETMRFDSSDELDACPHLRDRIRGACSAVCIPMKLLGRQNAVIHTVGEVTAAVNDTELGFVESVARQTENKITLMRALQHTALVSTYDELTGMLDAASIEAKMDEMTRNLIPYSIALCELDDFDAYSQDYGSAIADRAVRQFASSLREVVRPSDVVGRYTGNNFLVLFPNTTTSDAASALERVREHVALNLTAADVPSYTASFGVADSVLVDTLDDLLIAASMALAVANDNGRNRVVVSGDEPHDDE